MHILLSVLGWTLLVFLVLVILLLVLPVRAEIEYREGALLVRARVFGLPFRLYPVAPKTKKHKPKKKKPNGKAAETSRKKKKKSPGMGPEDIQNLLGTAGTFVRRMYRMIHIADVILILPIHREDAAKTALACGRAEAWLSGMAALLQNYFDLRIVQVRVLPDFTNEITAGVYLSCAVGARPIAFVAAGVHALIYLLRQLPPAAPKKKTQAPGQGASAANQKAPGSEREPPASDPNRDTKAPAARK